MFNYIFLISAIILVIIDSIYLNLIKDYFNKQVQAIQGTPLKINLLGALICYIFLITGLNYFIIKPKRSVQDAFLLGLVIYGVFETTNLAIFSKWSWLTVVIDSLWGGILFALTTYIIKIIRQLYI
jgi:uncharacterized membrane protein